MGGNFSKNIKDEFEEKKYLYDRNFYNDDDCRSIKQTCNNLEKHPLYVRSMGPNNSSVNNRTRTQAILYCEDFVTENEKKHKIISDYFDYCAESLFPVIMPQLYPLAKEIFGSDWKILRATVMYTENGCPEQEVHHDNNVGDNVFFISLPLHPTPIEQGPTIFYDDRIIGKYRNAKASNPDFNTYNNLGYFKDLKGKMKEDFTKARRQFSSNLGDLMIHRDSTLHGGGANTTKFTRKFLFITGGLPTTFWKDFFDYDKKYGLQICNSQQYVGSPDDPNIKPQTGLY
jgi:hypothetical protein